MYRANASVVDPCTMGRFILVLLLSAPALAAVEDARLTAVRAQLDQTYAAALRDGVPQSLLDDKVREGLAKNVPPERLATFLGGYEGRLAEAATMVKSASPALLKAIAEARAAGAQPDDLRPLVSRGVRSIDVVTDLSQRGFSPSQAAKTVAKVDARSLDRMAAVAQSLAARVGRTEALDAIARAADRGLGPDRAPDFAGNKDDRGPNRDNSGQRGPGFEHGKGKP